MSTVATVGASQHQDAYQAGKAAAAQALAKSADRPVDLILLFTTEQYDQAAALQGVRSVTGQSPLIGCCGGGIITVGGSETNGIAVMALQTDDMTITIDAGQILDQDVYHAAEQLAESLEDRLFAAAPAPYNIVLVLSDSADRKLLDIVAGMSNTLGPVYPLVGGGASDNVPGLQTCQFLNDQIFSQAIIVAALRSQAAIGIGVRHGWTPVGGPLIVTQSEDHFIVELNGRSAFEVFREVFADERPDLSPETFYEFTRVHPIGLPQISGEYLIREVIQVRSDGAIECVGHIPENAVVRFMKGDRDSLLAGARQAADDAVNALDGRPAAAVIVFDCISRLPILGDEAAAEIGIIREVFGDQTPLIGMYSFGEVANPTGVNLAAYHNKTMVICALAQN